jgi:hypothetical protein
MCVYAEEWVDRRRVTGVKRYKRGLYKPRVSLLMFSVLMFIGGAFVGSRRLGQSFMDRMLSEDDDEDPSSHNIVSFRTVGLTTALFTMKRCDWSS